MARAFRNNSYLMAVIDTELPNNTKDICQQLSYATYWVFFSHIYHYLSKSC